MYKILLVSPISDYKDYVLPEWISFIKRLQKIYNSGSFSLDIMLCDNSENKSYHKYIERNFGVHCLYHSPFLKNSRQFICESRNRLRNYFLASNKYNVMLSLECDVFPSDINFIVNLIAADKPVISHPYFIGMGDQSVPMIQTIDKTTDPPRETRNMNELEFFDIAGKTIRVFNAGLGCTLIRRDVIEKFPFRWDPEIEYHDDSFFADDLYMAGIRWYCDTSSICRHHNIPWNYFPKHKF